jgi:RNA polymerase sigma-32 factor
MTHNNPIYNDMAADMKPENLLDEGVERLDQEEDIGVDHLDKSAPLDVGEDLDEDVLDVPNAGDDAQSKVPALPFTLIPPGSKPQVYDPLRLYLREIGRFPMLEPEEERMLAHRVRDENDQDAAFRLVSSHLRLVVKIAMDFQRRWMQNVLDLIQEGNVGLMRAVQKFDPDKGIKFSYYASFWIKAYILKFIMDNWRMVKIGTTQAQRKLFYNLSKERQRLQAQGFDADSATISQNLNVSESQVEEMEQRMGGNDVSLDLTLGDDSTTTRLDILPALEPGIEETLAKSEISQTLQDHLESMLDDLTDKERDILEKRLLAEQPVTLREIGEKYGITRERVRQLEARLLLKLRTHLSQNIQDFSEDWITHDE